MVSELIKSTIKQKQYSYTPYGELTIFGSQELELKRKHYQELKTWCKNINTSLVYIWIDRTHISYNTSKVLMQLFFDLENFQKDSRIVVQWRLGKDDTEMQQTVNSFKNLFPHVSFILKTED